MRDESLGKGTSEEGQSLQDVVVRLKLHIAALERELAAYGSKYGLSDTARALLLRPQDSWVAAPRCRTVPRLRRSGLNQEGHYIRVEADP